MMWLTRSAFDEPLGPVAACEDDCSLCRPALDHREDLFLIRQVLGQAEGEFVGDHECVAALSREGGHFV